MTAPLASACSLPRRHHDRRLPARRCGCAAHRHTLAVARSRQADVAALLFTCCLHSRPSAHRRPGLATRLHCARRQPSAVE
jgi:hypothetical protein